MAVSNDFSWLTARLAKIGLADETIISYCATILEADYDDADRKEALSSFILEAASNQPLSTDLDAFLNECIAWTHSLQQLASAALQEKRKQEIELGRLKEAEILREEQRRTKKNVELSNVERKKRQAFLDKYAYESDQVVDGDDDVPRNDNALKIKLAEQEKRKEAQVAHAKVVQRNKEALEKQRLEKEKEKRGTQKKEKRRL
ncbi:hypothetical protein SeLEV6574_g02290 [Synchytrium endobioticum]|nr:hypothetical protein SeLEV6574_g02290 [Synchytrium endobioticum]